MGELCESCVREHDAVCVLALRPPQAERRTRAVHVLLLDTEGHHGPPQFSDRCVYFALYLPLLTVGCVILTRGYRAQDNGCHYYSRTSAHSSHPLGSTPIAIRPPHCETRRVFVPKRPLMPPKVKISLIQSCSCNIRAFVAVAHLYSFALGVWYSRTLTLSDCVLISHCIRLTGPSARPRATA